jgi:hypothetical protein
MKDAPGSGDFDMIYKMLTLKTDLLLQIRCGTKQRHSG